MNQYKSVVFIEPVKTDIKIHIRAEKRLISRHTI